MAIQLHRSGSDRVLKMERGCVEDQRQHLNTPEFRELLRLVEDDTAALRVFNPRPQSLRNR